MATKAAKPWAQLSVWSYAVTVLIFVLAPSARQLLNLTRALIGQENIPLLILALFLLGSWQLLRLIPLRDRRFPLVVAIMAAGGGIALLLPIAEERIHLLLFGLLGLLLIKDLQHTRRGTLLAFGLGFSVGVLDELFQWVLPNRVGDIRDVVINAVGVLWGIALQKALQKQV